MKLQKLMSHIRRGCDDYSMIQEGDSIAVGVSGGKDSLALIIALKEMQRFYPAKYNLEAITVSLGFNEFNVIPIRSLCEKIGVRHTVVKTDIAKIIFESRKESNPCSLCAKMRKGALNEEAVRLACNKVALGHNKDDIMETFFLSLFYEGRINTFSPVTYLDRKNIYSIRPMLYVPEADIKSFIETYDIQTVKNPCPVDGYTKREEIKTFVKNLRGNYKDFDSKVFGAIQHSPIKGWSK